MSLSFRYERKLWQQGYNVVAGIDEAGRGPLAGPVVAAAVVFAEGTKLHGLNDSKKLSSKQRDDLYLKIKQTALGIGVAEVSHQVIDQINIRRASILAMKQAVHQLLFGPDYLLIDGSRIDLNFDIPQQTIVGGDGRCASIAAASIVAKVVRDKMMIGYHHQYPEYEFLAHKGYGTKLHLQRLEKFGPSQIHRRSFSPMRQK